MKDIAKWTVFAGIFLVPAIVLIISNSYFFPFITGKNFAFRIIIEIITAAWIILAFYDAQYRPKFSWILGSFFTFIAVMFFANLFGENPQASFWSNFERMDGYVTLVHTFLYVLVAGSVMKDRETWNKFFITTLSVAVILSLYAFRQLSGDIDIRQGGVRLDGTLGNSSYMAIYMLFHIFITFFMLFRTKSIQLRYVYAAISVLFIYLLIQTATRGTMLGLVGGSTVMVLYFVIFGKGYPMLRKAAVGGIIGIVAVVGIFISMKDTPYVQESPYLARIATINLESATTRFDIWSMALSGVKERPLLGWGQSNYNYVFNKYYSPELHGQEAWFDRAHNIIMDWLIAGGVFGMVAYFSILGSAIYYLFFRPLFRKSEDDDDTFTVIERGVLMGLLAGYMIHNFVVFDNIVSYIFYGSILAYIHSRVGTTIPRIENFKIDTKIVGQVVTPIVSVVLIGIVYVVNVPSMNAAKEIIVAFGAQTPEAALEWFDTALERDSLGNQEIREQMTQRLQSALSSDDVSDEVKLRISSRIEEELLKQIEEKPGDARIEVFISSYYRTIGDVENAVAHLAVARELSPNKQLIIFEQGFAELQRQGYENAENFFKEAYELGTRFDDSRAYYAMAAIYNEQPELAISLLETRKHKEAFTRNQYALSAAYQAKMYPFLIEMFNIQIDLNPTDPQSRTNLSFVLNESGDTQGAIEVLTKAGEDIPSFKEQSQQFIASMLAQNVQLPAVQN